MLQNRVDPFGHLITTSARGAWMGNRGQLHNAHKEVLRQWKLKAWLICLLQFNGRHRQVMAPNRYTELFFMDEATAFAAGHRPCFECRRQDFHRFKTAWLKGNPEYGFDEHTSFQKIDEILHRQRITRTGEQITYEAEPADLPDGTFILIDEKPALVAKGKAHYWTPAGYEKATPLPNTAVTVLTPKSTVNAFTAGYLPQMAF